MNSVDPFHPTVRVLSQREIIANVRRWRVAHGKPIDPGFKNAPLIMLKRKAVEVAIDSVMGKEAK
tara:strand:+ start:935 stop:1129 length:195 start_codon:yes stop_codon:yes gene_type:complete